MTDVDSTIGQAGPPVFEEEDSGTGFLGGFDDSYEIEVEGNYGWGGYFAGRDSTTATLTDLREVNAGGYIGSDQWLPQNESPQTIAQLQMMLVEAGLLDPAVVTRPGYYDDETRGAYRDLLTRANALGTTWDGALSRLRSNPNAVIQPTGQEKPSFTARVSNPEDIRAGLRAGFKRALGSGSIDEPTLDRMIRAYQGEEIGSQRAAFDAQTGAGGVVTEAPSFETFVDLEAKKADPTGYDAYKALDAFSTILDTMGGGAGALSS